MRNEMNRAQAKYGQCQGCYTKRTKPLVKGLVQIVHPAVVDCFQSLIARPQGSSRVASPARNLSRCELSRCGKARGYGLVEDF